MKISKIFAGIAAAAVAVSAMAVSAFAFDMNTEYTGGWSASATIPKAEFEAVGGDVKVVLEVERHDPPVGKGNYVLKPMNICVSWDQITDQFTSDTAVAKEDGFFIVAPDVTSVEFVVPEATWQSFKGYVDADGNEDESAGLAFQVNDVIIKSATLSSGSPEGTIKRVSEEESGAIMSGEAAATEAAPAETEAAETEAAPAEETTVAADASADAAETTAAATDEAPAKTGNTTAAAIVTVMAVAGAAAVISKKRG